MRLFIFAIGGTGARVVRSLTMMLASGIDGLDSSTEIVPIIIDYDLANGDKTRAIKALSTYSKIHDLLYPDARQGQLYNSNFFMTTLTSLNQAGVATPQANGHDFEFNFGPTGSSIKYSDYLNMSALNTNPDIKLTEDLLFALYDSSPNTSSDAELNLDMAKGFKGNPNIGSVVFHSLRKMPEFQQFKSTFNATTDRVFIVSSIFGGTGASGFPEIVNAIRTDPSPALNQAIIGSALVLPYFDLQQYDPQKGDTGAVDAALFNAKTRAALGFYASSNGINSKVNAIYYVGDENHDAYQYNEGEARQENDAHVVEFVAATAILDFIQRQFSISNHDAYEFSIKNAQTNQSIQLPDFEESTHSLLLKDLSTFAIAMKFYRDVVCGDRSQEPSSTAYYSTARFDLASKINKGVFAEINQFLDADERNGWGFYHWLDELNKHSHKLKLYQMDKTIEMKDILAHKSIQGGFLSGNPMKDSAFSGELNKKTRSLNAFSDQAFFKVLRDVAKEKYSEIK